jgi:hypothetical protein
MEELMVPYPKAFYEEFTALGYRCQPRQYERKLKFTILVTY